MEPKRRKTRKKARRAPQKDYARAHGQLNDGSLLILDVRWSHRNDGNDVEMTFYEEPNLVKQAKTVACVVYGPQRALRGEGLGNPTEVIPFRVKAGRIASVAFQPTTKIIECRLIMEDDREKFGTFSLEEFRWIDKFISLVRLGKSNTNDEPVAARWESVASMPAPPEPIEFTDEELEVPEWTPSRVDKLPEVEVMLEMTDEQAEGVYDLLDRFKERCGEKLQDVLDEGNNDDEQNGEGI